MSDYIDKTRILIIDPKERSIQEKRIDYSYKELKKIIDCDLLEALYVHERIGDTVLVNEEGLVDESEKNLFMFKFTYDDDGYVRPFTVNDTASFKYHILCGKAVVIGCDNEGDFKSTRSTFGEIAECVEWDWGHLKSPLQEPQVFVKIK